MNEFEFIKVGEKERAVRLTLARPPVNVLNTAMMGEINACLESLTERTDLCVLVIDGAGKTFSAGVDVPEHQKDQAVETMTAFHRMFRLMVKLPVPTVAVIHGGVYGGAMELAIFCDIILAADDLKIGVPELTLGVFPPVAVAHLARLVGTNTAAELIYTGSVIDAAEALRIGLVNHIHPAADLPEAADKFVRRFTRLSAFSLRQTREAFRRAVLPDFERALDEAESVYLRELMDGHDPTEGLTAFTEKRKPVWQDR